MPVTMPVPSPVVPSPEDALEKLITEVQSMSGQFPVSIRFRRAEYLVGDGRSVDLHAEPYTVDVSPTSGSGVIMVWGGDAELARFTVREGWSLSSAACYVTALLDEVGR